MQGKITLENLINQVNQKGLIETIYAIYGKSVKIRILFPDFVCKNKIDELNLPIRGYNCLKRVGVNFVEDLINVIETTGLEHIRNLGKKTAVEIKIALLNFVYLSLPQKEQIAFLQNVLQDNN